MTKNTFKPLVLALSLALGLAACSGEEKGKTAQETPRTVQAQTTVIQMSEGLATTAVPGTVEALESVRVALLDISKLDAGAVTPRSEDVPLGPLFDNLRETFRPGGRRAHRSRACGRPRRRGRRSSRWSCSRARGGCA